MSEDIFYILGREVDILRYSLHLYQKVALGTFHPERIFLASVSVVESAACQINVIERCSGSFHFRLSGIIAKRCLALHVSPYGNCVFPVWKRNGKNDKLCLPVIVDSCILLLGHHIAFLIVHYIVDRTYIFAERQVLGFSFLQSQFHGVIDIEIVLVLHREYYLQRRTVLQFCTDTPSQHYQQHQRHCRIFQYVLQFIHCSFLHYLSG